MHGFPRTQMLPLARGSVRFEVEGGPVATYDFGPAEPKPCLFPVIGPSGRPVTRMGHPGDPITHAHHRSVRIAHESVKGTSFREEGKGTHIVHDHMESYADGDSAALTAVNRWIAANGQEQRRDVRRISVTPRPEGELWIDIECAFEPVAGGTMLGRTSFGFLAVRVAKTMSVQFGRGRILDSEGGVNEPQVYWRRARWVARARWRRARWRESASWTTPPTRAVRPTGTCAMTAGWGLPSATSSPGTWERSRCGCSTASTYTVARGRPASSTWSGSAAQGGSPRLRPERPCRSLLRPLGGRQAQGPCAIG